MSKIPSMPSMSQGWKLKSVGWREFYIFRGFSDMKSADASRYQGNQFQWYPVISQVEHKNLFITDNNFNHNP